jgi:hypothetical protein
MMASKDEKPVPLSAFVQTIDNPTMKTLMQYLKIEDYDCFVRFAQRSGAKVAIHIEPAEE